MNVKPNKIKKPLSKNPRNGNEKHPTPPKPETKKAYVVGAFVRGSSEVVTLIKPGKGDAKINAEPAPLNAPKNEPILAEKNVPAMVTPPLSPLEKENEILKKRLEEFRKVAVYFKENVVCGNARHTEMLDRVLSN